MNPWTRVLREIVPDAVLAAPASERELEKAGQVLGRPLRAELRELLLEANGVQGEHGLALVWSLDRIVRDNIEIRSNERHAAMYMPFEPLCFFADAGNGDQFAVLAEVDRPDVFVWDHGDDSRRWVAPDIARYLEWWTTGRIVL